MSSKRKSHRAKKRSDKRKASAELVREHLEASVRTELVPQASPRESVAPPVQAEAAAPPDEAFIPEDERSVPPAGDLDARFFSDPPSWPALHTAFEEDPFALLNAYDKHTRSLAPGAVARRARFARYVRGAVGASVLVCAAAVVKAALTHDDYVPPRRWVTTEAPTLSDRSGASQASGPAATRSEDPAPSALAAGENAADAGDAGGPANHRAVGAVEEPAAARALRVR